MHEIVRHLVRCRGLRRRVGYLVAAWGGGESRVPGCWVSPCVLAASNAPASSERLVCWQWASRLPVASVAPASSERLACWRACRAYQQRVPRARNGNRMPRDSPRKSTASDECGSPEEPDESRDALGGHEQIGWRGGDATESRGVERGEHRGLNGERKVTVSGAKPCVAGEARGLGGGADSISQLSASAALSARRSRLDQRRPSERALAAQHA